jgi:WD40 repeat protein
MKSRILLFISAFLISDINLSEAALYEYKSKLTAEDGEEGDRFGDAMAVSGRTLLIGSRTDDESGTDSGSAYIFDSRTGRQRLKLVPADPAAGNQFGFSVGISGNIAVVGAPFDDSWGSNSGTAYLFDATTGTQIAKLRSSDAGASQRFGRSIAVSGNLALIGAPFASENGVRGGAAYLFDISTGSQLAKFVAPDGADTDNFGNSVSMSGNKFIVGAWGDNDLGEASGSAYVFDLSSPTPLFKLTASEGSPGDMFGFSVSLDGDKAIVGAPGKDIISGDGAAYLFDLNTGMEIAKLNAPEPVGLQKFGWSVAIHGDKALIGVEGFLSSVKDQSAYLFNTDGAFLEKLNAPDTSIGDYYGCAVMLRNDLALVGAIHDDDKGINSGSLYVFRLAVPEMSTIVLTIVAAVQILGSGRFRTLSLTIRR